MTTLSSEAVRLADELDKWARDYATTDYTEDMATKSAALSTPAQAQQSIDAEALIRAVLPGGSSCDPQTVADEIRRYLGQWPDGRRGYP